MKTVLATRRPLVDGIVILVLLILFTAALFLESRARRPR